MQIKLNSSRQPVPGPVCLIMFVIVMLTWLISPTFAGSADVQTETPAARLCAAWDAYLAVQMGDFTASGMVAADALAIAASMHKEARELCAHQRFGDAFKRYPAIEFPLDPTIP